MKNHMVKALAILLAVFLPVAPALAGSDDGLYAPVAPEGSAFVRFVNAVDESDSAAPSIRGKNYSAVDAGETSAYFPVKAGDADIALGTHSTGKRSLEEGAYYTYYVKNTASLEKQGLKGGGSSLLKDQAISNPAKALISFYNLTGKSSLSLKTADGKVEVTSAETGKAGYRDINGVPVTLAVFDGAAKVADVGQVVLKRGEATTILVTEKKDGTVSASTAQATTDTTQ